MRWRWRPLRRNNRVNLSFEFQWFYLLTDTLSRIVRCDDGRSAVRLLHHGVEMKGDWMDTLQGAINAGNVSFTKAALCTLMTCFLFTHPVIQSDLPDPHKIAAVHSVRCGAMHIFPCENNADGWPAVWVYTRVEKMTSNGLPREPKTRITAEDVLKADMRVRL